MAAITYTTLNRLIVGQDQAAEAKNRPQLSVAGSRVAATTAAAPDSVQISSLARQKYSETKGTTGIVQILSSSTGRTPAKIAGMADLTPPESLGSARSMNEFKGTRSLVDGRAQRSLRMPDSDLTPGGPNGVGALSGSKLVKPLSAGISDTPSGMRTKVIETPAEQPRPAMRLLGEKPPESKTAMRLPGEKPIAAPGSFPGQEPPGMAPIGKTAPKPFSEAFFSGKPELREGVETQRSGSEKSGESSTAGRAGKEKARTPPATPGKAFSVLA